MDIYTFKDLFDIKFLQKLMDSLSATLRIRISIRGPKGERLTRDSDFCPLCSGIIGESSVGKPLCEQFCQELGARRDAVPYICRCGPVGFTSANISIISDDIHVANIVVGQVRLAENDLSEEEYRATARSLGIPEDIFLENVREIPVISRTQFENMLRTLSLLADQLSFMGYNSLHMKSVISSLETQELLHQEEKNVLEKLAEKDSMTGLYNRRKFEEVFAHYAEQKGRNICMISADANFLKLTNDIFGHKAGDQLLITIARIMDSLAKKDWLVARCGGDEFCVILPDTTLETALDYCRRVARNCSKDKTLNLPLSIALGAADWNSDCESLQDCLSRADTKMYQDKEALKHEMHVPDYIMDRLYDKQVLNRKVMEYTAKMTLAFADYAGFAGEQAKELSLAARYQDIGMAKLPESFSIRGQSRTKEEASQYKSHVSHSYTMARQFEELYKVAYIILCTHENWDGTGYPNGTAGNDIPLGARLIHIVSDYTYWTLPTITGGNYSREAALKKMEAGKSVVYDPELTDKFFRFLPVFNDAVEE